jgi:hypothetical protein
MIEGKLQGGFFLFFIFSSTGIILISLAHIFSSVQGKWKPEGGDAFAPATIQREPCKEGQYGKSRYL